MSKFGERFMTQSAGIKPTGERRLPGAPKTAPGQLGQLVTERDTAVDRAEAAEERANALQAELISTLNSGAAAEIEINELHEIEGRRRQLTAEQFAELVENLRHNELITPITVRPRNEGGFEIVSGHNRVAAYRELGHSKIPAVVKTLDEERAVVGAFYANLLQPELPDFEKYLGFCTIRKIYPDISVEEIGKTAGISERHVRRILSYGDLPDEAISLLQSNMDVLGSTAAADLAKLARDGKHDIVILAVRKLVAKEITQDEAIRLVANHAKPAKATPVKPQAVPIKAGKEKFMTIRPTGSPTSFRLEFVNAGDAEETMTAFQEWIKDRLAAKKERE